MAGLVRVDAGGGSQTGIRINQLERALGVHSRLTHHHDAAKPSGPGSVEHFRQIGDVGRVGQMTVSVD